MLYSDVKCHLIISIDCMTIGEIKNVFTNSNLLVEFPIFSNKGRRISKTPIELRVLPSLPSNISHEDFLAHSIGLLYEFPRAFRQRLHGIQVALGIKKQFASGNHPVV